MFRRGGGPERGWKLVVVSHTHWDREWYLPFQEFRAELVEAVDSLLDLMAESPEYRHFTLDGQAIILEDYLEIRPERERELRHLIARGRILIGPWYVMPDEFLVSGESLLRNLLEGRRVAARFGPVMQVGYLPDPFGHIAQMPQILRGFGIDSAVIWRGVGSNVAQNEVLWEAPDGSQVLMEHLPGGYDNAAVLPTEPGALMERLKQIRAQLEPRATTRFLLLMNGDDHMFPQPEMPAIISEANRRLRDAEMIHGTLPGFIKGVREAAVASGIEWGRVRGELRSSELAHLLAGVLSSRMRLKQRNFTCQTLLERWAEPFSSFANLVLREWGPPGPPTVGRGTRHSQGLLRSAWRYLLMNQPHDSISGCSIDQVHGEMETRYDWCEQVATLVRDRALELLAESTDTGALVGESRAPGAIVVFNSEAGPRTDFVAATVQLPAPMEEVALLAPDGRQVPCQVLQRYRTDLASTTLNRAEVLSYLRLVGPGRDWPRWKLRILEKVVRTVLRGKMPDLVVADMDVVPGADPSTVDVDVEAASGKEHNYDAVAAGMRQLASLAHRGDARLFRIRVRREDQVEIGFVAPDVPAHGLKLFHFGPATPSRRPPLYGHEEATLENEYLSLQVSPADGSVRLIDRESGAIYWDVNSFVDGGDAGDEYTYSPPTVDRIVQGPDDPPTITVEERGPARQMVRVEFAMRLPKGLTEDRRARSEESVLCPVATWLAVYPGVPRVDIRTVFTNRATDHRLRVHFPTHLDARFSHADGQFAVIQHPIEPPPPTAGWIEHPTTTNPQLAFVDVHDDESGLLIANRGLPEFDVALLERGPCIALTLLRCVGWLSRDDLATRHGAAGPVIPTPGAQMLGTHTFEYSLVPHVGGWENAIHQAYWFARPLRARWTSSHPGPLGPEVGFVAVSPASLILSAVKPAEKDDGSFIVRLYNVRDEPAEGVLRSYFALEGAEVTNLAEEWGERLDLEDEGTLRLSVGGHQIVTLRLIPRRRPGPETAGQG